METNQILHGNCVQVMCNMPEKCVDLTIGSPPYVGKGERYGTMQKWGVDDWICMMDDVVHAALRVTRNVVVMIANNDVLGGEYRPACEGLIWRLYRYGVRCERPAIWHKNAAPSKRPWFGNDWEFCMAFRPHDSTEYFDWEAIAQPPKYKSGGAFRQRSKTGARRAGGGYPSGKLARPRDVIRATVGGGHMGSKLAHENEAPYPEKLVLPFVLSCCPPGGVVLDPFAGSGTTLAVAEKHGRRWLGIDLRESQVALSQRRIQEVTT